MRFKRFGKTEMNVSVATVGTWAIGGTGWGDVNKADSIKAIRAMVDNGVNFIDTAPVYGKGHSEEVVGEAIRDMKREDLIISTKAGLIWGEGIDGIERDITYKSIMWEIDQSLKRLGTDYVDLYLVHKPDFKGTPTEETMRAMMEIKKSGKARHIGLSNYSVELTKEAEQYGDVEAIQPPFSMVDRSELAVMEYAKSRDMGVMTYGSLGAGILTGAIRTLPNWDPSDTRYSFYNFFKEPKFSKCQELLGTLDAIAAAHGKPVAQVAVNWSTQNPLVDTALMGVRNVAEADENCAATDWTLTDEEIATINAAIEKYEA
ncbi:aldo/keto reductase [Luoshenia tenuis]|jgi:aryl-alcohol dehydrogenase-like predicted oxidoreductase|uniref:aldo/keto reductase n=1 Tax=Luoshenia tenuis TaxID=2763654 RepID=UPI003D94E2C3